MPKWTVFRGPLTCLTRVFVGSCLATKVFIGNFRLREEGGSSQSRQEMNRGQLLTNQLHEWVDGALAQFSCYQHRHISECVKVPSILG